MSSRQFRLLTLFLVLSVLAGIFYQIPVAVPAAPFFDDGSAYKTVFGIIPRVLVGGWLAVFIGDISNNYVLAKLKVLTNGRFLWLRIIASTVVETLLMPVTYLIVNKVKKFEGVDYYDNDTNFNPFSIAK